MRMWNVNPKFLCNQHLLGEHFEMHMFVGAINKGASMNEYINKGLVNIMDIPKRHEQLSEELISRGMNHNSPLPTLYPSKYERIFARGVNVTQNIKELQKRCSKCKTKIEENSK